MPLPPTLLEAVSAPNGGEIVFVLGAGCSVEAPTNLPMSYECSIEAHRRLVADGILQEGECLDPGDLSVLADTVVQKVGSQVELVNRLPRNKFLWAQPNDGYLVAAALLREQAVAAIVTLNFDLAITAALSQVGASEVTILSGPQEGLPRLTNLIYLHRNAQSEADKWILTTSGLTDAWRGQWEEIITRRVIAARVTVFAGLGTPAGVLIESVKWIRKSNVDAQAYIVGPTDPERSRFLQELALPRDAYLQMSWNDFMRALDLRISEEHRAKLQRACEELIDENGWHEENVIAICTRIAQLGILEMGRMRADWIMQGGPYLPIRSLDMQLWGDLVLAIALIERTLGAQANFLPDGLVEFRDGTRIAGLIMVASGRGTKRWYALETDLQRENSRRVRRPSSPGFAVISGAIAPLATATAPTDLIAEYGKDDIVTGSRGIKMISVDQLRNNPELIRTVVNN